MNSFTEITLKYVKLKKQSDLIANMLRQWVFLEQGMDSSLRNEIYNESVYALEQYEETK